MQRKEPLILKENDFAYSIISAPEANLRGYIALIDHLSSVVVISQESPEIFIHFASERIIRVGLVKSLIELERFLDIQEYVLG